MDIEGHDIRQQRAMQSAMRWDARKRKCTECVKHCTCTCTFDEICCCFSPCRGCCVRDPNSKSCSDSCGECCGSCSAGCSQCVAMCTPSCGYTLLQFLCTISVVLLAVVFILNFLDVLKSYDEIQDLISSIGSLFCTIPACVLLILGITNYAPAFVYFKFLENWATLGAFQVALSLLAWQQAWSRELRISLNMKLMFADDLTDALVALSLLSAAFGLIAMSISCCGGRALANMDEDGPDAPASPAAEPPRASNDGLEVLEDDIKDA